MAIIERTKERLPYNGRVLRWARERRRLGWEEAARKAAVSPEKIMEWEDEKSAPTVRQARQLAALYDRPFLEFFAETEPKVAPPRLAPDFRFLKTGPNEIELAALEGVQEWAEEQRLNAIGLYEALGDDPPATSPDLQASLEDDPEIAARRARQALKLPIEVQLRFTAEERRKFPAMLRGAIETAGPLVLKHSGLSQTRTRGICLYDEVLPVIVFGSEAPGGQVFTLAHELGHVALGKSALSGAPIIAHRHGSTRRRVEGWCNSFAAAFLMPRNALTAHPLAPRELAESIADNTLTSLANAFSVSRHAMLIRLTTVGLVDPRYYWREKRKEFLLQEANYRASGRSTYYGSRFRNALGDRYTALVLEAFSTDRIGAHTAAEFMGIKNVRHLQDIRDNFGT